jgi:phosphoribosylanthranilate isomerase
MAEVVVKICGLTRVEDAEATVDAGADWIGLNFWPRSRRYVTVEQALAIAEVIPGDVKKVGVFVNAPLPQVIDIAGRVGLDLVQLHGDETADDARALGRPYVRALRIGSARDVEAIAAWDTEYILLDTPSAGYGGSGQTFDWSLAASARRFGKKLLLAGGLDADNVARAVREVRPFGVDVAGGVESAPGLKDAAKLRRFVDAAKGRAR